MAWECLMDCQGAQSQKEGQEDQGEVNELGRTPLKPARDPYLEARPSREFCGMESCNPSYLSQAST